ncbi:MAG: type I pullulanase [Anaeroplasma sp.]
MQGKIQAYIDSFEYITILVDKHLNNINKKFYLYDDTKKIELEVVKSYEEYSFFKYIVRSIENLELHKDYQIKDENGHLTLLKSGSIVRTEEFAKKFNYDGPLGFEYHKDKTIFRIWSPVAKEIVLELYDNDEINKYHLKYTQKGLWEIEIKGDLEGYGYIYYVRVFNELVEINDPYAISSAENGSLNYVIDINKLYKMKYPKPEFSGIYTDAIIYEASIRDFTCDLYGNNKGTYLGMIEDNALNTKNPIGINYISSLGITHLQLMPTFDFGGIDDIKKNSKYNWGYNPEQFFVPSGWYSRKPNDPYSRINELLELIDNIHKKGLRVVMDVVFNHVYKCEIFSFDHLVPGYFYRVESDGKLSNASGCGNVIATERYMASRFVIDVLKYYAKVFNISGFRFDLMGLLDINTLNNAKKELEKIDKAIMLYGEGWNMNNPLPDEYRPHMFNHDKMPGYAFFNDRYRDFVKGSQWNKISGYTFGDQKSHYELNQLLMGSCIDYFKFSEPVQSINYVECHDNYTLFDFGKYYLGKDDDDTIEACKLALEIILVSQGIPFIHAGEEFFRTKKGIENSYCSNDSVNRIDYRRRDKYISFIDTIKDLINIRKKYPVLRLATKKEIENRIHCLDGLSSVHTTGLLLEDRDYNLIIIIKNDKSAIEISLDDSCLIFDGEKSCNKKYNSYILAKPGVYIFKKEKENAINW